MEDGQKLLLQAPIEVDEEVTAREDVDLGEGRIGGDVLRREHQHLADLLLHAEAVVFSREVAPAKRFGDTSSAIPLG